MANTNAATYNILGDGKDQLASASQTVPSATTTTTATTTALQTDLDALRVWATRITADLVTLKAIKGSA